MSNNPYRLTAADLYGGYAARRGTSDRVLDAMDEKARRSDRLVDTLKITARKSSLKSRNEERERE